MEKVTFLDVMLYNNNNRALKHCSIVEQFCKINAKINLKALYNSVVFKLSSFYTREDEDLYIICNIKKNNEILHRVLIQFPMFVFNKYNKREKILYQYYKLSLNNIVYDELELIDERMLEIYNNESDLPIINKSFDEYDEDCEVCDFFMDSSIEDSVVMPMIAITDEGYMSE